MSAVGFSSGKSAALIILSLYAPFFTQEIPETIAVPGISCVYPSWPHKVERRSARWLAEFKKERHLLKADAVLSGGVGGIRTLGPLLTATRFPVVLVMTTSILLHINF